MAKILLTWAFLLGCRTLVPAQNTLSPAWMFSKSSDNGGQAFGWGLALAESGQVFWTPSLRLVNWPRVQVSCHLLNPETGEEIMPPTLIQENAELQAYSTAAGQGFGWIAGRSCSGFINTCDQWLVKTTPQGTPLWSKTWDVGGNYDELDGLAVRAGDGIYLGGWAGEVGTGIYDTDFSLRKVDFDGNVVWENHYGLPTTAEHQDGHFVVDDTHIFAAGLWGGDGIANLHEGRAFLAKCSKTNGALLDSVHFGAVGFWLNWENAWGMASDGQALYLTGVSTPMAGNNQIFVARFSKSLALQWLIHWGGDGVETARAIAVSNGHVFVGGTSNSTNIATGGAYDAVLLAFDANTGELETAKTWGDSRDNEFRDLVVSNEAVFLSGTSGINLFNSLTPANMEAFLLRIDIAGLITALPQEPTASSAKGLLFPNPAKTSCVWRFVAPESGMAVLEMADVQGKVLRRQPVPVHAGENALDLDLQALPKGWIAVSLFLEGKKITADRIFLY